MNAPDRVLDELQRNYQMSVARLWDWLRIPSISADPSYQAGCRRAASWILAELKNLGFEGELVETQGNPVVMARFRKPGGKRVLFYGHYDVQPADPLEPWETDPFEPVFQTLADGREVIRARGAADDKGQVMTFVSACKAWIGATGSLPFDVTLLIEGEEETGSAHLKPLLEQYRQQLECDLLFVCDTNMWNREKPAITRSLRGLLQGEITVRCARHDLHSGLFGGAAQNAIIVLCQLLAKMKLPSGKIAVPEFYDAVAEPSQQLLEAWSVLDLDERKLLGPVGLTRSIGESDRTLAEQVQSRPSFDINGIYGGYEGAGGKTIIPSEATAKLSFRLVADQDPDRIWAAFQRFINAQAPVDCTIELRKMAASHAYAYSGSQSDLEAVAAGLAATWGHAPVVIGTGVSIPVISEFKRVLGLDAILVGFGQEDDRIHAPNEKYDLRSFRLGAQSWVRILFELASRAGGDASIDAR